MRECLEEDVLQAYFDGELSPELMERVATHMAACAQCHEAAREIETESLMVAEAFAHELNMSVPTGRLRLRLDAAIAEMEATQTRSPRGSQLRSWLATLIAPLSFTPQYAAGFASLVAVLAFGAIFAFIIMRPQTSGLSVAREISMPGLAGFDAGRRETGGANPAEAPARADHTTVAAAGRNAARNAGRATFVNAGLNGRVKPYVAQPEAAASAQEVAAVRLLPGEKNYLKVIASLDTAIKSSGDNALRPTLRAEYERNLEVVDEAIAQTRVVAQRNPQDKDAAEFLLSAYQSKVDLMNTVAEQAQLSTMYR